MSFKFNHKNSTDWIFQFLLVLGLVLLYFRTMSDFANLEDSGLFISVAHEPGIAHPPGYPLYTMLAHLFTWIPLGSIAERVHALSAIAGISSCILLFQISRELKADSLSALVAASCLGVSSSFWYQAITAEVYTLNTFFFLLLFLLFGLSPLVTVSMMSTFTFASNFAVKRASEPL